MSTHDFNYQGPKHLNNVDWENHEHQRIVAACLVHAAYVLEGDRREGRSGEDQLARPWWEFFGFECISILANWENCSYGFTIGAIFRLKEASRTSPSAPAMVIAVRGTVNYHDWGLNLDMFLGRGRQRDFCRIVMLQAESLVHNHGMESNLWLCGHSLGADVATYVGEQMALKGRFFTTFLFNPPYILNKRPQDGFQQNLNDIRAVAGNLAGGVIAGQVGRVVSVLAAVAQPLSGTGDPAVLATNLHDKEKQDQLQQFDNLNKWDPRVYVNPKDYFCVPYIEYFEKKMHGSPGKLPERIASATLVINLDEPGDELPHFKEAYSFSIMEWFDNPGDSYRRFKEAHSLSIMQGFDNPGDAYRRFKEAHSIMQWWKPGLRVEAKRYVMA